MSINFFKGHPTRTLFPVDQIAAAYKKVLLDSDYLEYESDPLNQHPLTYGTDPGNHEIRTTVAAWNNRHFGFGLSQPEHINLTGGASYGAANVLVSATDAASVTQRAFIVSPTYFLINAAFIDAGFAGKLTAIEETPGAEYEIDLAYLESQLQHYSAGLPPANDAEINIIADPLRPHRKLYRFVIYLVPTFSNPGGLTYSLKTRTRLLELARHYDVLIISDDVYDLLDYTDNPNPLPRFNYLDQQTLPANKTFGNTISNATFSKIAAPGLRVGWQESATNKLVDQLACTGANRSGGTPGQLATFVVNELIANGELDTNIARLKVVYRARAAALKQSVAQYLPNNTRVLGGDGGYFVWVEIKGDIDHETVVTELQKHHGVVLASGNHFEVVGDRKGWGKNSVRLSISYLPEEKIHEGIKIWGQVLKKQYPQLY